MNQVDMDVRLLIGDLMIQNTAMKVSLNEATARVAALEAELTKEREAYQSALDKMAPVGPEQMYSADVVRLD